MLRTYLDSITELRSACLTENFNCNCFTRWYDPAQERTPSRFFEARVRVLFRPLFASSTSDHSMCPPCSTAFDGSDGNFRSSTLGSGF
jgi:hypothetical protein